MEGNDLVHFPVIKNSDETHQKSKRTQDVSHSLPLIETRKASRTKSDFIIPETPVVIGIRSAHKTMDQSNSSQIPNDWQEQELQCNQQEIQKTKLEWENDIARHILSLYATTNAVKNIKESNSLLDFVGEKPKAAHSEKEENPLQMTITTNKPMFRSEEANERNYDSSFQLKDRFGETEELSDFSNDEGKEKREKKKKGKKRRKKRSKEGVRENESHHMTKEEQDRHNQQFIDHVINKLESSMSLSKEKNNYRITNTIKTKDGREIVVRGSPKCYPIWFVSSGDVFVDWTGLVGGKRLQSHLSVLYENQYYDEYVNILETMLLSFWREKSFGKEEFTIGSFGKSDSAAATPYSGSRGQSRPFSSSSKQQSRGSGRSSRVQTANSGFSAHYQVKAKETEDRPRVSFYEDLLDKEIEPSLRPEIEQKVELFNLQSDNQGETNKLPSSSESLFLSAQDNVSHDLALAALTLPEVEKFWKQLVLTTLAIGILCIEKKQFEKGMKFFIRADEFSKNDDLIPRAIERKEYRAHVKDAMAYYFYRREKFIAALAYSSQALEVFEQRGQDLEAIASCLLHIAASYSLMSKFKESHRVLFQFLAMVENGRLALQDATPKQLCLVAVGYHNLAVVQLKLAMPDLACKSSQNARKIARLCLAYSNRWINIFQYTHEIAISDMKYELQSRSLDQISPQQMLIIKQLAEALFSIDSQA